MHNGSLVHDRSNMLHNRGGMDHRGHSVDRGSALGDNSVESVDGVSSVVHSPHGTVGFHQRVLACRERRVMKVMMMFGFNWRFSLPPAPNCPTHFGYREWVKVEHEQCFDGFITG